MIETKKKTKKIKDEETILDEQAQMYAVISTNEIKMERKIQNWMMCRCYRCHKPVSLFDAVFDGNENAIHKVCPF